jgi:hypothetical protein
MNLVGFGVFWAPVDPLINPSTSLAVRVSPNSTPAHDHITVCANDLV